MWQGVFLFDYIQTKFEILVVQLLHDVDRQGRPATDVFLTFNLRVFAQ